MAGTIDISVLQLDDELVELSVFASNERFSGKVSAYADVHIFSKLAAVLDGFPANAADTREFEFGTFDASFAGGGASFQFRCLDGAGHACVEVHLRADPRVIGFGESASFSLRIEAAAVDALVRELRSIRLERGTSISLQTV